MPVNGTRNLPSSKFDGNLIDNYIYLFHTDEWVLLPSYPESIADQMQSTFGQTNALSRTAPIYSYSYSGPRTVQFQIDLHRDMLNDVNLDVSNLKIDAKEGRDLLETLINRMQAIALPRYDSANKQVVPPMIAVRLGNEIFIKGVVIGGVSITYKKPIMDDGRYAQATISFTVYEVTPYDAESVSQLGSFRGITKMFKDGIWR